MTSVRKKATIAAIVAFILLAATVLSLFWFAGPRIRILDPRFQILAARVSQGTEHWIYEGNQIEGHVRCFLNRMGFRVTVPQKYGHTQHTQQSVYAFIVRYSGDLEEKQLVQL